MQRVSRRSVLVAGAGLLGGCSGLPVVGSGGGDGGFDVTEQYRSWQYDRRNSGRTTDVTGLSDQPSVAWQREVGPGNGGANPVVADGTVFVGSGDSVFYALEAGTGDVRWSVETGKWIHSTAALGEDFVVFGCDDFRVRAYHWDGSERWTFDASFEVSSDLVLADGRVYATDTDGTVYAIDRSNGEADWTKSLETDDVLFSPVLGDDRVYVGAGGTTWALSAADGTVEWTTDDDRRVGESHAFADGTLVGVTSGGLAEETGTVYALDAATGEVAWFHELDQQYPGDVAVAGGTVYVSAADGLAARSLSDGTVTWRAPLGGQSGTPVVVDDTVYCGAENRTDGGIEASGLHAVATDGTVRWSADVSVGASSLAVASGTVFTKHGTTVYALR